MLDGHQRDDDLLLALSRQTEQLVSIAAETDFRMSATAAYAVIVAERLEELQVQPISGFQSLADFTSRRFNPAVRTCAALTQRLALLNGRASQFTNLLRTRIETHIENQNGRLLASIGIDGSQHAHAVEVAASGRRPVGSGHQLLSAGIGLVSAQGGRAYVALSFADVDTWDCRAVDRAGCLDNPSNQAAKIVQ